MYKNQFKKRSSNRGMTFVELLLVMAILSVVMLAVMSLYVPAHQSTVAQTQVSDVNDNLRLALKVMTQDLLVAGFLVPVHPIVFSDAAPSTGAAVITNIGTVDNTDFVIRSRIVGNDFARVTNTVDSGTGKFELTVSDSDMYDNFPDGSRVRLFEPISSNEIESGVGTDANRAYPVVPGSANRITIDASAVPSINSVTDIPVETVVVRVRDENQPPLQTIRYRLNDGALLREINGERQVLARNIESVDFNYFPAGSERFNRVDIVLTGQTEALKDDAISGAKTRQMKTSVKLRNIN